MSQTVEVRINVK